MRFGFGASAVSVSRLLGFFFAGARRVRLGLGFGSARRGASSATGVASTSGSAAFFARGRRVRLGFGASSVSVVSGAAVVSGCSTAATFSAGFFARVRRVRFGLATASASDATAGWPSSSIVTRRRRRRGSVGGLLPGRSHGLGGLGLLRRGRGA